MPGHLQSGLLDGWPLASQTRSLRTCKVAYWMVGHFASKTRSPGTCKVAYKMVGHLASKTRSPGTCKVACWMVSHFASKTPSPGTCKVACGTVGYFANKTRSLGTCKVAYWLVQLCFTIRTGFLCLANTVIRVRAEGPFGTNRVLSKWPRKKLSHLLSTI